MCVRWDELVCHNCPCLGSQYADKDGDPTTVDAVTNEPKGARAELLEIRRIRRFLWDGEQVPLELILSTKESVP